MHCDNNFKAILLYNIATVYASKLLASNYGESQYSYVSLVLIHVHYIYIYIYIYIYTHMCTFAFNISDQLCQDMKCNVWFQRATVKVHGCVLFTYGTLSDPHHLYYPRMKHRTHRSNTQSYTISRSNHSSEQGYKIPCMNYKSYSSSKWLCCIYVRYIPRPIFLSNPHITYWIHRPISKSYTMN